MPTRSKAGEETGRPCLEIGFGDVAGLDGVDERGTKGAPRAGHLEVQPGAGDTVVSATPNQSVMTMPSKPQSLRSRSSRQAGLLGGASAR